MTGQPPAGDARPQQLVLNAQFADPLHSRGKLTSRRIRLAFPQRAIQRGFGLLPPPLKLVERYAELAREILARLAPQQAKHHPALAAHAPALAKRQRTTCRTSGQPAVTGPLTPSFRMTLLMPDFTISASSRPNRCREKSGAAQALS
jgi:hypothetical protein